MISYDKGPVQSGSRPAAMLQKQALRLYCGMHMLRPMELQRLMCIWGMLLPAMLRLKLTTQDCSLWRCFVHPSSPVLASRMCWLSKPTH